MKGFSVPAFSGPIPSRGLNGQRRNGPVTGLGGLTAGGGGRPSRAAVAAAATAPTPKPLSAAASPREPTIGAELRAQMGLERPAAAAYSPRQAVAKVAGARGRWSNLVESADDEVRAIMTPKASPGYGGFDDPQDDFGFGDLGLDEHERAVLEQSLRRQATIERKLNRKAQDEREKKSRSQGKSSHRQREQRKLDLSNGTAGPEQFAAAAIEGSPRSSRRARGVIKPTVPGRHVADDVSQWDDEVALAGGLPAVRGASTTPTNELDEPRIPRLKASAPVSARSANQSPRVESGSSRRRERRARRERQAANAASDEEDESRTFSPDHGIKQMDKMEKLRIAMTHMDGAGRPAGGSVDSESLATAAAAADTLRQEEAEAGDGPTGEAPAQQAAAAAAAAVAAAKAKAEAAVKEAARLAEMEMLALAAARREAALRSELQALKLGQLCTRATNDGVDALSLEQAQDSDTPKEAVIALLLKAAVEQSPETPRQQTQSDEQPPADHARASSSPASNPTEPSSAGDSMPVTVSVDGNTTAGGRSAKRGRKARRTTQLSCPQCSEEFKAHAPVKQKRTRKSRCGGCGEALTVGSCPGCAELTVWTAAARTHQNASCTSCFASFHVAKCPGCAEVAAYVGTHAAAQFSASSTGSPHTRSKEAGSATASAQCSGLTCESCSLHFFECGCPACGVWGAHPARVLTALIGGGGKKGRPELECDGCSFRFRYKPHKDASRGGSAGAPDPFSSSSSDDTRRAGRTGSDGSSSDTETESDEDEEWVTPQEWRSWRAPREQRWDNVESRSRGTVLGAGVGRADAKHRTGKQSGEYGAGGSGTSRRPGAAPTAAAVIAASARHLSKEARASLHID